MCTICWSTVRLAILHSNVHTNHRRHCQAKYGEALETAPPASKERAIYHSNRAACLLRLDRFAEAVTDCTQALDLDPGSCKALMRRAAAYESLDDLEHALLDLQQVRTGNGEGLGAESTRNAGSLS